MSEPDPQNPEIVLHRIKFSQHLPESITSNTVEAIEHLRSALDQTAFAVASNKGNKGNKFPFGDSVQEFENNVAISCKYIPDEIKSLFRSFKPYKGGDDLLWALNKLCNVQKHRLIIPAGISVGGMHISEMTITGEGIAQILVPRWDSEKNEIVFAKTGAKRTLRYDVELPLTVSFGEVAVARGKPVLAILRALASKVEGIVRAVEVEAKRIGVV